MSVVWHGAARDSTTEQNFQWQVKHMGLFLHVFNDTFAWASYDRYYKIADVYIKVQNV